VPRILEADFVTTAVDPKGYPSGHQAEVAFVGRSNVGKSSMINTLASRKKLVRVSNTPGRTRTLNFFDVVLEHQGVRHRVRLADLPGYGFARVSKAERAQWKKMISAYLEKRQGLQVVVCIIDAEVGPTSDDFYTLDFLQESKHRLLVVATKLDRLAKARRKPRMVELARQLDLPLEAVVGFSSTDRLGVDEVWESLLGVVGERTRQQG
jgi:GTP-binding protein